MNPATVAILRHGLKPTTTMKVIYSSLYSLHKQGNVEASLDGNGRLVHSHSRSTLFPFELFSPHTAGGLGHRS